jgi:hypothetical protein
MNESIELQRTVQVWSYTVGHSRLLLRATKDRDHPMRVEILFKAVAAMSVPTVMRELTVREASDLEREEILSTIVIDKPSEPRCFVLEGPGFAGWVIAGVMVTIEDEGEYHEPSSLLEGLP